MRDGGGSAIEMSLKGVASFLADLIKTQPKQELLHSSCIDEL